MEPQTVYLLAAVVGIGSPVLSLVTAVLGNYLAGQIREAKRGSQMDAMSDTIGELKDRIKSLEALVHDLLLQLGGRG